MTIETVNKRRNFVHRLRKDIVLHRRFCGLHPFYEPQLEVLRMLEQHTDERRGDSMVVMSSRQTMKNECSGFGQLRFLLKYPNRGGTWVRAAPTWKPQIINSKDRLKRFIQRDGILRQRVKASEGFQLKHGEATVAFFSADSTANVVGATADRMLDLDEAHKVDEDKFNEDFLPMTGWENAPQVYWGVGGVRNCLLHKAVQTSVKEKVFKFPWDVWAELRPQYAAHVEKVLGILGDKNHPIFKTQYRLMFLDAFGTFFLPEHIHSILDSDFTRGERGSGLPVYVVVDIGGEDRFDRPDELVRIEKPEQDSTFGVAFTVDWKQQRFGFPIVRVFDLFWRTGPRLTELQRDLEKWVMSVKPREGVIDARGLGNQIASYMEQKTRGRLMAYMASPQSVSSDCFDILARVNHGTVKLFRDDGSEDYAEFVRHLKWASYEMSMTTERIKMVKPENVPDAHIDGAKALTYINQILETPLLAVGQSQT